MPDLSPHLQCPVCLGTTMEKVTVEASEKLEVDQCGRCGGIWLEYGEVQRLRAAPRSELWKQIEPRPVAFRIRCHDCHAPLERAAEKCPACGWVNLLDCPCCDRPMHVQSHMGLRLDLCRDCKGVWFDHHELKAIWSASFDRALQKRGISRSDALTGAGDGVGDLLLDTLFYAPDLVYYGARAAGHVVSASAEAVSQLPGAIASAPEAASAVYEAVGEGAGSVFETIVEIIGGVFDGL